MGTPTLPVTRLSRYIEYKESVKEYIKSGNAEKLIQVVKVEDAQNIFEELISPWQEMSRKHLESIPDTSMKSLLEQVPISFSNELIASDKTKVHVDAF